MSHLNCVHFPAIFCPIKNDMSDCLVTLFNYKLHLKNETFSVVFRHRGPHYVSIIKGGGLSHTIDFHESLL